MYSKSTHRPIDEDTPCPLCGALGHVEMADRKRTPGTHLPLRCANGHTITMVGLEPIRPELR
jgi:hypothetical protein